MMKPFIHFDVGKSWQTVQGMIEQFFTLLPKVILGVVVFAVFVVIGLAIRSLVSRETKGQRRHRNLAVVLGRLANVIVLLIGLLVALTVIAPSFKAADLIRVLGIGSIAIGFAFRDILQNFLAGILLLVHEPFRIGDQIQIDAFEGTVENIETRATTLKTYDGRRIVIPNTDLFTKTVTVNTAYETRRSQYDVGIGYGDDIATAKKLILDAIASVEDVLADPAPEALTIDLADYSVKIRARWWIKPSTQTHVIHTTDAVLTAIKTQLSEAGIDMPYPTQQLLFHDQTEATDGDRTQQHEGWPAGKNPPQARNAVRTTAPR